MSIITNFMDNYLLPAISVSIDTDMMSVYNYDISYTDNLGVSTVICQAYSKEDLVSVYAKNEENFKTNRSFYAVI